MDKDKKEQRISIRFPLDLWQTIRQQAKEHNRSFNGEVVWMLRAMLKQDKKQGE